MIVKALLVPFAIILLVFGGALATRVFRDRKLLLAAAPIILALVLLSGFTAMFKLISFALIAAAVAFAVLMLRKLGAGG